MLGGVDGAGAGRVGFRTQGKAAFLLLVRPGSEPALGAGPLALPFGVNVRPVAKQNLLEAIARNAENPLRPIIGRRR